MIPPCDPAILETNPQFKKLYQHLTLNLLNPDGSTSSEDAHPDRRAVREEFKNCQVRNAKKEVKKDALRQVAFDLDNGVPDETRDCLEVITLYLDSQPSTWPMATTPETDNGESKANTLSLLAPDIDAFHSNIPALATPISKALTTQLTDLRTIANIGTGTGTSTTPTHPSESSSESSPLPLPPTATSRFSRTSRTARARQSRTAIPQQSPLSVHISERVRGLRAVQLSQLPAARREMACVAAMVLATRTQVLERTVVLLERAKHGAVSRAMKARAEHLATVAEGVEGKLSVLKLEISATLYTPDTTSALKKYRQHLREVQEQLKHRKTLAVQELKAYGDTEAEDDGGSGGTEDDRRVTRLQNKTGAMRDTARRYGALAKEIEEVKMEIRRLEG